MHAQHPILFIYTITIGSYPFGVKLFLGLSSNLSIKYQDGDIAFCVITFYGGKSASGRETGFRSPEPSGAVIRQRYLPSSE